MNAIVVAGQNTGKRMSSLEISQLVEKRHDNVKRTVESLVGKAIITQPQIEDESYKDGSGRKVITKVYLLDKRSSLIVVAQLSPEFTARVVDRWQELEAQATQQAVQLPDFTNPAIAARAWADEVEKKLQFQNTIAVMAPKAALADAITESEKDISFEQYAKAISGKEGGFSIGRNNLVSLLREEKLLKDNNLPHQRYIDAGWFRVAEKTYERAWSNGPRPYLKTLITGRGQVAIFDRLKNSVHLAKHLNRSARCNRPIINSPGRVTA